jgi:hypothetical protein
MGFFVGTVNGGPLMSRKPTYEELKQRVEELEKKAASKTEKALLDYSRKHFSP